MKNIKIELPENPYTVKTGKKVFPDLLKEIKKLKTHKNLFVIVDSNVFKIYKSQIDDLFSDYPEKCFIQKVKVTEKTKSFETVNSLYSKLIAKQFGRDTLIIAIGGGILGDIAGFVAATYMRGIPFIQVPTTILAAVDSSVGGKTGINFDNTKNIVGAFHQPEMVLIDTEFFNTLPEEEIICGLGEIAKYALLTDDKFFNFINKNFGKIISLDAAPLQKVISVSVNYKASVVIADEKENGIRKLLNLGHTFAHAIEVEQNHKIKHGQAVVVGITCACYLANKLGYFDDKLLEKYLSLLVKFREFIEMETFDIKKLFALMNRDKKNRDNKIKFVLPVTTGNILIDVTASKEDVIYSLENGINLFV